METPGARMSVVAVWFELAAITSDVFTDPTEITFDRHAGRPICVSDELLPDAANIVTPFARSVLTADAAAMAPAFAASQSPVKRAVVLRLAVTTCTPNAGLSMM